MGSDPSPFMANLFLFYYESKFLKELTKTDNRKARLFSSVFRYLDDLIAINDGGLFEQNYREIYPPELELKKENNGYSTASFLDLDIAICGKRFNLKLYDKRDAFPFSIVRMPNLSNNMPSRIFYATIGSEILRIGKCTTERTDFINTCCTLMVRMKNQGATYFKMKSLVNTVYNKHPSIFAPFHENATNLLQNIFPYDQ